MSSPQYAQDHQYQCLNARPDDHRRPLRPATLPPQTAGRDNTPLSALYYSCVYSGDRGASWSAGWRCRRFDDEVHRELANGKVNWPGDKPAAYQSPNTHRTMRASFRYPPFLANGSSFQNFSAAARSGSSSINAVPIFSVSLAERSGPRKMKLAPYDAQYVLLRACRCLFKNSGLPVLAPVHRNCCRPLRA